MSWNRVETSDVWANVWVEIYYPTEVFTNYTRKKLNELLLGNKNNHPTIAINIANNIDEFNTLLNRKYENTKELLQVFHNFLMDVTEWHELLYFISQHGSMSNDLRVEFAWKSTHFWPSIWKLSLHKSLEGSTRISPRFSFECIEEIDVNDKGRLLDMIQNIILDFLQEQLWEEIAQEK